LISRSLRNWVIPNSWSWFHCGSPCFRPHSRRSPKRLVMSCELKFSAQSCPWMFIIPEDIWYKSVDVSSVVNPKPDHKLHKPSPILKQSEKHMRKWQVYYLIRPSPAFKQGTLRYPKYVNEPWLIYVVRYLEAQFPFRAMCRVTSETGNLKDWALPSSRQKAIFNSAFPPCNSRSKIWVLAGTTHHRHSPPSRDFVKTMQKEWATPTIQWFITILPVKIIGITWYNGITDHENI
jgi:hypothetical protein